MPRAAETSPAQHQPCVPPQPQPGDAVRKKTLKRVSCGKDCSALLYPNRCRPAPGRAETAPNPLCALLRAAAKAGAARKRSAWQQPHAAHICPTKLCHRMLQQGNILQLIPQPLSVKDNLLQLLDQVFVVFFPLQVSPVTQR